MAAASTIINVTRRSVLSLSALSGCLLTLRASQQEHSSLQLLKDLGNSSVKAVSPNGKLLLIEDWTEPGFPLRILEVGTWRSFPLGSFEYRTLGAEFFGDGSAVLVTQVANRGETGYRMTAVEFETGKRTQWVQRSNGGADPWQIRPAFDRMMLRTRYARTGRALIEMRLIAYPELQEMEREEFTYTNSSPGAGSWEAFSGDRNIWVCVFRDALMCKRLKGLETLWIHRLDPDALVRRMAVSSSGSHVAARLSGAGTATAAARVLIIDGKSGQTKGFVELATNNFDGGVNGIDISDDGNTLAVVVVQPGERDHLEVRVQLIDVASGRVMGTALHRRIDRGKRQFLNSGANVEFSSDGLQLVSSGQTSMIWALSN